MSLKIFHDILAEWDGTPYRHNLIMKKHGVDCICFVVAVMNEYYQAINRPDLFVNFDLQYPSHWYMSNDAQRGDSLLLEGVYARPNNLKQRENKDDYQEGDLLLFKHHDCPAFHTAFYLTEKRIVHSISGVGVTQGTLQDARWGDRHTYTFKINQLSDSW